MPKNNGKEIKQIILEKEDNNFDNLNAKGSLENENKNKENPNTPKNKTLLNIKKNLKSISIPCSNDFAIKEQNQLCDSSNLSLEQKNKLNSKNLIFNNNNLLINENNNSNDNKKLSYNASQNISLNSCQNNYSANLLSQRQLHNSNDNVFSFFFECITKL